MVIISSCCQHVDRDWHTRIQGRLGRRVQSLLPLCSGSIHTSSQQLGQACRVPRGLCLTLVMDTQSAGPPLRSQGHLRRSLLPGPLTKEPSPRGPHPLTHFYPGWSGQCTPKKGLLPALCEEVLPSAVPGGSVPVSPAILLPWPSVPSLSSPLCFNLNHYFAADGTQQIRS